MAHSRDATWHYRNHGAGFDLWTAQPGQARLLHGSARLRAWKRWLPPYLPEPLRTAGGITTERSNMVDGMSFEGFFNAVFRSMAEHGFGNPGRTAMNAGSFNAGELGVLPLRAFQMGVAYLVSEDDLPRSYNDRASALATAADAHALLEEIQRAASGRILTAG